MRLLASALGAVFAAALSSAAALAGPAVPEPAGYHGEPYRSPVPATLAGAEVVDLVATDALMRGAAVLIDVLPEVRRPDNLPADTIWHPKPHVSIRGAVWLPGTGYEALATGDEAAFQAALKVLSKGDTAAKLVFFCKADCWMSWNAAKRAVGWGYSEVAWFPGGTDDWTAAGRELVPVTAFRP